MGITPADFLEPEIFLWPENWPCLNLFTQLSTQWRVGMNGPTGLDYNVFFHEMDRNGIHGDEYDEMLAGLRVIETTALDEIHKS